MTVLRDVPSVGIFFTVYEAMKFELSHGGADSLGFGQLILAGLLAGIPAAALVTPMDVVKTRWQAKGGMEKYKVRPPPIRPSPPHPPNPATSSPAAYATWR